MVSIENKQVNDRKNEKVREVDNTTHHPHSQSLADPGLTNSFVNLRRAP